jgi:hypothetical protein
MPFFRIVLMIADFTFMSFYLAMTIFFLLLLGKFTDFL